MYHKISLTESIRHTLNQLDSVIQEAKPDNLGQGMLDKLFKTYQSRDINDRTLPQGFENGLQVADYIYQHVGPNFLAWAAKQYNQDRNFFLHDLPEWKNALNLFSSVAQDKRIEIERDINRYPNIDSLRQVLDQASGSQREIGSKFYDKVTQKLEPFVESGQATWIYKGSDYSIYCPKTWEASKAVATACPHKTSVCVAASKDHYDRYTKGGVLMYIIGQDDAYLCYIKTKEDGNGSEFANSVNDHSYDLAWQMQKFPRLKPIVAKVMTDETDAGPRWAFDPPTEDEAAQAIRDDPALIGDLPRNLRTPRVLEALYQALDENPMMVWDSLPSDMQTKEMLKRAIDANPAMVTWTPTEFVNEVYPYAILKDPRTASVMRADQDIVEAYLSKSLRNHGYDDEQIEDLVILADKNEVENVLQQTKAIVTNYLNYVFRKEAKQRGFRTSREFYDADTEAKQYYDSLKQQINNRGADYIWDWQVDEQIENMMFNSEFDGDETKDGFVRMQGLPQLLFNFSDDEENPFAEELSDFVSNGIAVEKKGNGKWEAGVQEFWE